MDKKPVRFLSVARRWITKNQLHGPHAFLRFVQLCFVERLNASTREFIFKGGNLLWVYIKTPRATLDLDFVTHSVTEHEQVQGLLETVCKRNDESLNFSLLSFKPTKHNDGEGAAVNIGYKTAEGAENSFGLDIVYAAPSDNTQIDSPLESGQQIAATTMENIVADKVSACVRFRGGNTRMKDFDDLWRISQVSPDPINWKKLRGLFAEREIQAAIDPAWVNVQMEKAWGSHRKRNAGLPASLTDLILAVNHWLAQAAPQP